MPDLSSNLRALGSDIKPGEPIEQALTAQRMNAVFGLLRTLAAGDNIFSGLGVLKRQVGGGVLLSSNARGGGGGGAVVRLPFDVTFTDFDPSTVNASVNPGTFGGLLSTNFDEVFPLDKTSTYYLTIECTASDGQLASALLAFDAVPPPGIPTLQGQPPTAFKYLLGVVINGTWYRTIAPGAPTCSSVEQFRVSKASPAPGTLPYDIFYTWRIANELSSDVWTALGEELRLILAALPPLSTAIVIRDTIAAWLRLKFNGVAPNA